MKTFHPVTQILVVLVFAAFCVAMFTFNRWESQARWAEVMHRNAILSYWTMRTNAETSRKLMSEESYEALRQKIDADWKRLNPGLEIPDKPEDK